MDRTDRCSRVDRPPHFRRLVIVALSLGLSLVHASVASAHLAFVRSDPPAGAALLRAPTEVRVTFSASIDARSTGSVVGPGGLVVSGVSRTDAADIVIPMSSTALGTHTVRYTAIDPIDAHPTEGSFEFSVVQPSPTPSPPGVTTPTPARTATVSTLPSLPPTRPSSEPPPVALIVVGVTIVAGVLAFALVRARSAPQA